MIMILLPSFLKVRLSYFAIFFAVVSAISCSDASNSNTLSKQIVTPMSAPKAEPSEEEVMERRQKSKDEAKLAIATFVKKNFDGWVIEGISGGETCELDSPCHIDLRRGDKSKVVTIIVRQFFKSDGSTYWSVSEANNMDLLSRRIVEMKEAESQDTLDNLTSENCEKVIDDLSFDELVELKGGYEIPYEPEQDYP